MTPEERSLRDMLAEWMIHHGFATGPGDTAGDLLAEMEWQIDELRCKAKKK